MRTKRMKTLVICAAINTAAMTFGVQIFIGYDASLREFRRYYKELETDIGDINKATEYVMTFARTDAMNLASEGLKEALEWTRKYVALYPPKETETYDREVEHFLYEELIRQQGFDVKRRQIFAYLAFKGDARDLEVVKRFDSGTLGALLERRVAGENVFGYDADKLKPLGFLGLPKTFFPSVANTGPQAVYVREILYRCWEENGRDASKIPQELLTMVVSFDAEGVPVCSVDLAKHGLSMPVIEPKPNWNMFSVYKEVLRYEAPPKITVKFSDLAEAAEVRLDMKREAPDWKGLYKDMKKAPPPEQQ
ncbi:MAG: hypothetical protein FWG50_11970 [Kiritimatiellaeota bacterium]|nr:hypothetical protein [Kiritimatiellota bacterium]